MLDIDQYESTAAWLEYCDGMTRFQAETEAARRQGYQRWEAVNEIRKRHSEGQRHHGQATGGNAAHDLPGVQPAPEEETRPMSERDVHERGRVGVLSPLRMEACGEI